MQTKLDSMEWEVGKYVHDPNYYAAEAVDDEGAGEGEIYVTVFLGPRSEARAKEFAHWQNELLEWKRRAGHRLQ
jgi:hypothetical protein